MIETINRTCDGCTGCCEGWLHGKAYNHTFYKGKPCFYLKNNCTIYENRPIDPCKSYKCSWLSEDIFPMWMRPDLSKIIITKRQINNIDFYEIIEAGKTIESFILNWIIQWALNNNQNIYYEINGSKNKIGNNNFVNSNDI